MDTEIMIRELERVEEKHKHDKVFTGQLDVAKMAHDTRKRLEELKPYEDTGLTPPEIMELKERNTANKIELDAGRPICPVCGRRVVRCYDFCPDCGQRLEHKEERRWKENWKKY